MTSETVVHDFDSTMQLDAETTDWESDTDQQIDTEETAYEHSSENASKLNDSITLLKEVCPI